MGQVSRKLIDSASGVYFMALHPIVSSLLRVVIHMFSFSLRFFAVSMAAASFTNQLGGTFRYLHSYWSK